MFYRRDFRATIPKKQSKINLSDEARFKSFLNFPTLLEKNAKNEIHKREIAEKKFLYYNNVITELNQLPFSKPLSKKEDIAAKIGRNAELVNLQLEAFAKLHESVDDKIELMELEIKKLEKIKSTQIFSNHIKKTEDMITGIRESIPKTETAKEWLEQEISVTRKLLEDFNSLGKKAKK